LCDFIAAAVVIRERTPANKRANSYLRLFAADKGL